MNDHPGEQISVLEWAVRAIAQPAPIQASLFPSFVPAGEELALEFERGLETFKQEWGDSLSAKQKAALEALDMHLLEMTKANNMNFWFEYGSLESAQEWSGARRLALLLLKEMEWPSDPPPPNNCSYGRP